MILEQHADKLLEFDAILTEYFGNENRRSVHAEFCRHVARRSLARFADRQTKTYVSFSDRIFAIYAPRFDVFRSESALPEHQIRRCNDLPQGVS